MHPRCPPAPIRAGRNPQHPLVCFWLVVAEGIRREPLLQVRRERWPRGLLCMRPVTPPLLQYVFVYCVDHVCIGLNSRQFYM